MFNDDPQHFFLTLDSYSVLRGFKFLVMASRIQIGKVIPVKGRKYKIGRGTAKGKKYKACTVTGRKKCIQFGAKGYTIATGTKKGHRYCSRSSGITSSKKGATPNDFSRIAWNCRGKKSMKR